MIEVVSTALFINLRTYGSTGRKERIFITLKMLSYPPAMRACVPGFKK